jgi:hypothetical protein
MANFLPTVETMDELFLVVVKNLPQALLLALVAFVIVLVAKDVINGLRGPFLNADKWQALPLVDKKVLTHNTRRFRFALPHEEQSLGLPLGQHISLKLVAADGTEVIRRAHMPARPAARRPQTAAGTAPPPAATVPSPARPLWTHTPKTRGVFKSPAALKPPAMLKPPAALNTRPAWMHAVQALHPCV